MASLAQRSKDANVTMAEQHDFEDASPDVPKKWRGTEADNANMKAMGRVQELRRNFTFITILGFGSTLICTWEVVMANIYPVLTNGGTAGFFWGWIIVTIGYILVYASLSEMASMAPTSGGQYHWVSEFAPPSCQRFLSYIVGWLCFTGWQSGLTAISFIAGTIIQGLIALNNPGYVLVPWHGTLLTIAVCAFAIFFNTVIASKLPLVEGSIVFLHISGLFIVIIVLWTLAPRHTAQEAFLEFTNNGGWDSQGTSLLVGLYPLVVALIGFDSVVHMSEEIKDAASTLPRAIMWSTYLNAFLGFLMVITLIFTWGDAEEIAKSPTGYPFIQVLYNVTNSRAAADVLSSILIITLTASVIACVATASRQLWAFARDQGVPFSSFIAYVNPRLNIPVNAVLISLAATSLLALLNIGSYAALNAIFALDCAALLSSYMISIGCLLLKRLKGEPLPPRPWSLGSYGLWINIAALCWLAPIFVFTLFPSTTPTDAAGMNWGILLFGAMILFATAYYFVRGKKVYISPRERLRRDIQM
ncbi:hypothetical protein LTR37_012275 [Vermiconidia calcicola]|uniref:Uncharacterized protein n=1 Tax=Vermiconidia calcicola TaxID=1690605 RepID=A0ACC3N030_9PEZI|nr:hypothetical protein LTR37_012275 [Vermiconidia calcicola]